MVSGADGLTVRLIDISGRTVESRQGPAEKIFHAPTAGVYLLQVGNRPARRIVVVK